MTALHEPPGESPAESSTSTSPEVPGPKPAGTGSGPVRLLLLAAGVVAVGVWLGTTILVMIAAIVAIIFLHELGHYVTAKWSGMKVTEFFLGFGPRLWSFRRGETEYGVKAIPAGAYVRIIGMNNLDEVDPADEPRTFRQQSYPKRMLVVLAGSGMHFLIALVLIFALLVGWGGPGGRLFGSVDQADWQVGEVIDGSAAEAAGIEAGDRIVAVGQGPVESFADLGDLVRPRANETVTIEVLRDGAPQTLVATIGEHTEGGVTTGLLGVRPTIATERVNPVVAVPIAFVDLGRLLSETVQGMAQLLSPEGISGFAEQVADGGTSEGDATGSAATDEDGAGAEPRPVSIVGVTRIGADMLESGVDQFLFILIVLNGFIGLFNLIPLLPLDGGHAAIATYERIREGRSGRRHLVDVTRLLPLTYMVVLALVLLGVSAVYLDIVNPPVP